ncbi:MAG: hypothetical protein H6581_31285 [Bacteroidia bacterium]|nr:hypothetical protein [Bacteroidia bacterium]
MDKTEELLRALATLQTIDSRRDNIVKLRGSLPEEVDDLKDDVEGFETRKARILEDIKALENEISKRNENISNFTEQIRKYQIQINEVKNNREFEALQKEIEYADLEIQTSEKKIRQFKEQIESKNLLLDETQARIDEKNKDLDAKKEELEIIVKETEIEEAKLQEESEAAGKIIEDRILGAYNRIRNNMRNGLAVVGTDRDACGGCFAIIPPQVHLELRQKKKLITCENCGRILVDHSFFEPVNDRETA